MSNSREDCASLDREVSNSRKPPWQRICGIAGEASEQGNRTSRLSEESRNLLVQFVESDYEDLRQKTKLASWAALKRRCDELGIVAPTYVTFCSAVRERPTFLQTLKRKGRRASYAHSSFYFELEPTTPRHGDRPFEIGHIDHTELDVEVVCSHTGRPLGRPWLTVLIDAFSRRCLAFYLTFDEPSYRSCMMILRDCVRRHSRLPQTVVLDGGPEFQARISRRFWPATNAPRKCVPRHKLASVQSANDSSARRTASLFTTCVVIHRSRATFDRLRRATSQQARLAGRLGVFAIICRRSCSRYMTP